MHFHCYARFNFPSRPWNETFYVNETRRMAALDVDFPIRAYNGDNWTALPLFRGELVGSGIALQAIGVNVRGDDGSVEARPTVPGTHSVRIWARDMYGMARMDAFRHKDEVTFLEQDIEVRVRPPLSRLVEPSAACTATSTSFWGPLLTPFPAPCPTHDAPYNMLYYVRMVIGC